jgi:hypothetical protein
MNSLCSPLTARSRRAEEQLLKHGFNKKLEDKSKKMKNKTFDAKREGTYKPRITAEHLRKLWLEKQKTGKKITQLVSEALVFISRC